MLLEICLCLPVIAESGLAQAMKKAEAAALMVKKSPNSPSNSRLRKSLSLSNLDSLVGAPAPSLEALGVGRVSPPESLAAPAPIAKAVAESKPIEASTSAPPHGGGFLKWWKEYLEKAKRESIEAGVWDPTIKTLRGHI